MRDMVKNLAPNSGFSWAGSLTLSLKIAPKTGRSYHGNKTFGFYIKLSFAI